MRITIVISVRQTGHPAAISDTRMAHGSQKRACPHGTNAKPACGATRHTSQQSSEVDAADDSDAVNGQFSDFYSAVIIRQGLFSPSVQPLFDLVLKLHGLALSGLAMSTLATWSHVVQSRDVRSRDFSVPRKTNITGQNSTTVRWIQRISQHDWCSFRYDRSHWSYKLLSNTHCDTYILTLFDRLRVSTQSGHSSVWMNSLPAKVRA